MTGEEYHTIMRQFDAIEEGIQEVMEKLDEVLDLARSEGVRTVPAPSFPPSEEYRQLDGEWYDPYGG